MRFVPHELRRPQHLLQQTVRGPKTEPPAVSKVMAADLPYVDTLTPEQRQRLDLLAPRPAFYDGRYWEVFEDEKLDINDPALAMQREEYIETATAYLFGEAERRGTYPVHDDPLQSRQPLCRQGETRNCYIWAMPGLRQLEIPVVRFPRLHSAAEELPSNWIATIFQFYMAGNDPVVQSRVLAHAPIIPQAYKQGVLQGIQAYGAGLGTGGLGTALLPAAAAYLRNNRTPDELRFGRTFGYEVQGLIVELEDLRSWLPQPSSNTYSDVAPTRIGFTGQAPVYVPNWVPDYTLAAWQERAVVLFLLRVNAQRLPEGQPTPPLLTELLEAAQVRGRAQIQAQKLTLYRPARFSEAMARFRMPADPKEEGQINYFILQQYLVDELKRVKQFDPGAQCIWDLPGLSYLKPDPPSKITFTLDTPRGSEVVEAPTEGNWAAVRQKACADPKGFLEILDYIWQAGQVSGPSKQLENMLAATGGVAAAGGLTALRATSGLIATLRAIKTANALKTVFSLLAFSGVGALGTIAVFAAGEMLAQYLQEYLTKWVNPKLKYKVERWLEGTGIKPEQFWFWAMSAEPCPPEVEGEPACDICVRGDLACAVVSFWKAAWSKAGSVQRSIQEIPGFPQVLVQLQTHYQKTIATEQRLLEQLADFRPEAEGRAEERHASNEAAKRKRDQATDLFHVGPDGCRLGWLPFALPKATPTIGGVVVGALAYGVLNILPSFGSRTLEAAKGLGALGAGVFSWYSLASACGPASKQEADETLSTVLWTAGGISALVLGLAFATDKGSSRSRSGEEQEARSRPADSALLRDEDFF